jgi:hypothetical protein
MAGTGWFAEYDKDSPDMKWKPTLQIPGFCFSLPVWFQTEEACRKFIGEDVIGQGELD